MSYRDMIKTLASILERHISLSTRIERIQLAAGVLEQTPREPLVQRVQWHFQDKIPLATRGRRRWNATPRPLDQVDCYGFHTAGVNGGFGVSKRQVAAWMRAHPLATREEARAEARHLRYLGLPYHSLSAPGPELVVNHEPETYTWQGHKMNAYTWGHAVDDVWDDDEDVPQDRVDTEIAHLVALHEYLGTAGLKMRYIEFHCQHSNKPRDPGKQMIQRLFEPFAALSGLHIRRSVSTGKGRPLAL